MIRLLHLFCTLIIALLGFCSFNLFFLEQYAFGIVALLMLLYVDYIQCTVVKIHLEKSRWLN